MAWPLVSLMTQGLCAIIQTHRVCNRPVPKPRGSQAMRGFAYIYRCTECATARHRSPVGPKPCRSFVAIALCYLIAVQVAGFRVWRVEGCL